jgi:hypothetical protein
MAISGLWSMAVSVASAPAGSSPVFAKPSKMPVCGTGFLQLDLHLIATVGREFHDDFVGSLVRSRSPSFTRR